MYFSSTPKLLFSTAQVLCSIFYDHMIHEFSLSYLTVTITYNLFMLTEFLKSIEVSSAITLMKL